MSCITSLNNRYGDDKVHDACGLFGIMDTTGRRFGAEDAIRAISNMHDRGNGLGGGFAAYGIYPQFKEDYALHVMYLNRDSKRKTEDILADTFRVRRAEEIPVDASAKVVKPPVTWRYFVGPKGDLLRGQSADEFVVGSVMRINTETEGAYVFSSGKNMGVFKGVGFPEDVAKYFRLSEYEGYLWVSHSRFPTNTPGWWGGAHPFSILDWTVVHNGELSSYGTNRRCLETYGYNCTMQTDTEVLAYALDLLRRRQNLPLPIAAKILAPPLWEEIDEMEPLGRRLWLTIRASYGGLLMNGPFSIIAARQGEMVGLGDRMKLRPLVAATNGDCFYISSEEAAIRAVAATLDRVWNPVGGEPVVATMKNVTPMLVAT